MPSSALASGPVKSGRVTGARRPPTSAPSFAQSAATGQPGCPGRTRLNALARAVCAGSNAAPANDRPAPTKARRLIALDPYRSSIALNSLVVGCKPWRYLGLTRTGSGHMAEWACRHQYNTSWSPFPPTCPMRPAASEQGNCSCFHQRTLALGALKVKSLAETNLAAHERQYPLIIYLPLENGVG